MPRTCDFPPGLREHAFGTPDRPAPAGMRARAQGSSRGSAGQPRVPQQTAGGAGRESRRCWAAARPAAFALGTHGAGRRRSAGSPAPAARPATRRNATPGVRILPEPPGRPPRAGRFCRRGISQSRARPTAASLCFTPGRPWTASFPGKISACREDGRRPEL